MTLHTTSNQKETNALLPTLGWREWVGLPDFGISHIKAKVDTGAKTSAIHAFQIEEFSQNGIPFIRFFLHPEQRHTTPEIPCSAPFIDQRSIRSSNGIEQLRYVIQTDLRLGNTTFPISLTLTNRDQLGFRMLLGRDALTDRYLIDPAKSYLIGAPPNKQ